MQPPAAPSTLATVERTAQPVFPLSPRATAWLEYAQSDLDESWPVPPLAPPYTTDLSATTTAASAAFILAADSSTTDASATPRSASWPQPYLSVAPYFIPQLTSSHLASAPAPLSSAVGATNQPFGGYLSAELIAHRQSDTERRRRETAALSRLDELTPSNEGHGESAASGAATGRHKRKREKLSVLEAGVARIERLERLLSETESANRLLSEAVSDAVARERRSVQYMDASRALRSAGLLSNRLANALMECCSGRLLDASSGYFDLTGFTPGSVLRKVASCADPALRGGEALQPPTSEYPLIARRKGCESDSERIEWKPLQPARQYPRTLKLLRELLAGERSTFRAASRQRWADGYVYEVQSNYWVVDWQLVQEEDGRRWRRPLTFGCASSMDEHFRVGEE